MTRGQSRLGGRNTRVSSALFRKIIRSLSAPVAINKALRTREEPCFRVCREWGFFGTRLPRAGYEAKTSRRQRRLARARVSLVILATK